MSERTRKVGLATKPAALSDNLAFQIVDLARAYRKSFDRQMSVLGLDRSQWPLLINLWYFEGVTQQELADMREMTRGGMNKMIDRLEAAGFVRRAEGADRRSYRIFLTDAVRPLVAQIDEAQQRMIEQSLSGLTAAEAATLKRLLGKVRKGVDS